MVSSPVVESSLSLRFRFVDDWIDEGESGRGGKGEVPLTWGTATAGEAMADGIERVIINARVEG